MSDWQLIETAPKDGTPVLLYRGNLVFTDQHGNPSSFGECRDHVERCELGFRFEGTWCQAGTGHDCFEDGPEGRMWQPTHWMPLPAPPPTEQQ